MTYETISVTPLGPHLGAEIGGVDLTKPLSNKTVQEIHDALFTHVVIFFRDQDLTPEQHVALAGIFGEPLTHPFLPEAAELPEITIVETGGDDFPARPGAAFARWHTDVTFFEVPPLCALLHCKILPEQGGNTMWASMYAAYEALSPSMQAFLGGLTGIHDMGAGYREYFRDMDDGYETLRKAEADYPRVEHPVVRTHPITGRKILFVNESFTEGFKELSVHESAALLDFLLQHQQIPEFQVRFRWAEKSLAIWDERATLHYPIADYGHERRVMHRVMVKGERPY